MSGKSQPNSSGKQKAAKRAVRELEDHNSWGKKTGMEDPIKRVRKRTKLYGDRATEEAEEAVAAAEKKAEDEATAPAVAASLSEGTEYQSSIDFVSQNKSNANDTASDNEEVEKEDGVFNDNDNVEQEEIEEIKVVSNDDDKDKTIILEENNGLDAESKGFDDIHAEIGGTKQNEEDDHDPENAVELEKEISEAKRLNLQLKKDLSESKQLKLDISEKLSAICDENTKLLNAIPRLQDTVDQLESLRDYDQNTIRLLLDEIGELRNELRNRDEIAQLRDELRNHIEQLNHRMDHFSETHAFV